MVAIEGRPADTYADGQLYSRQPSPPRCPCGWFKLTWRRGDATTHLHSGDFGWPFLRSAGRQRSEAAEDSSRGNSWHRSSSEPRGAGEVRCDKSILAVDATAGLGRRAKPDRRAALRRIGGAAS